VVVARLISCISIQPCSKVCEHLRVILLKSSVYVRDPVYLCERMDKGFREC
jgi:hypothetical protein